MSGLLVKASKILAHSSRLSDRLQDSQMAGLNSSGRVNRVVYHTWDIRTEFIRTDGGIRQTPHSPQSGVATQPRRAHPAYRGDCHFKYALSSRASHMIGPFAEIRTESRISHSPRPLKAA